MADGALGARIRQTIRLMDLAIAAVCCGSSAGHAEGVHDGDGDRLQFHGLTRDSCRARAPQRALLMAALGLVQPAILARRHL